MNTKFKGFFLLTSVFFIFSVMFLALSKVINLTPRFDVIQKFDDDLYSMKKAYDECRSERGEKVSGFSVITLELGPPETKTYIKRKFVFDSRCEIKLLVY